MNYIEIVGPPGAGKTTLLNKLIDERKEGAEWCTFDEAIIDIAQKLRWSDLGHNKAKGLFLLNKIDLFNKKTLGISNKLVKSLRGEEDYGIMSKYEDLIKAQIKAVAELNIDISPLNLFSILAWNRNALDRNFLLEEFSYPKTVVMDEGPLKTHYGLSNLDWDKIDNESLPRAVIAAKISVEENVKRILLRYSESGNLSRHPNEYNGDSIELVTTKVHQIFESNLSIIKKLGIPMLEIDLEVEIDKNCVEKTAEFIEEFGK